MSRVDDDYNGLKGQLTEELNRLHITLKELFDTDDWQHIDRCIRAANKSIGLEYWELLDLWWRMRTESSREAIRRRRSEA